jgi:glutamate 5-kinase
MQFLSANARRVVIKLGTNTLTSHGKAIHTERVNAVCEQVSMLRSLGLEVIIVSSGAIGLGMGRLGLDKRPRELSSLQACAAIGQPLLMSTWLKGLDKFDIPGAEVLLTREDVRGRNRHMAIRNTLERLLKIGVVPIVNENDTVSAEEIKFGDNDILSALVASLLKADLLVLLSTIPGLIDREGSGEVVAVIPEITAEIRAMAGGAESQTSVGGMISKIEAASIATQSGCGVFIGHGDDPGILSKLAAGNASGSFFLPRKWPMAARKRWIAFFEKPAGFVTVDEGAEKALRNDGRSLLAKGLTAVTGEFEEGRVLGIRNSRGIVFARGITGYDSSALKMVIGQDTSEIRKIFPHKRRFEVVHRNGFVLI